MNSSASHRSLWPARWAVLLTVAVVTFGAVGSVALAAGGRANLKFERAQKAYDSGNFEAALVLYHEVARELSSPNALFMAGRCEVQLHRPIEAFETLSNTLQLANARVADDKSYLRTRDAAAAEREAVAVTIGRVLVVGVAMPSFAIVTLTSGLSRDGIAARERTLRPEHFGNPIGVEPGRIVLAATALGYAPFRQQIDVPAGGLVSLAIRLEKVAAPSERPASNALRVAGFVSLGGGLAGMATFAAAGLTANARYAQLQERCTVPPCRDPDTRSLVDEGRAFDLAANLGLGVGLAALVAGTTMVVVGSSAGAEPAATVSLTLSPLNISLTGFF